ncbi:glycosyl hydrolase family 28-related protein [Streptomyces sp. EKS3.2]|uniref:glycosyl hydrolase family 28-related protein n=1 Tax=Streptomyces sp. EKS3.2 TaxID=3461008 RepID=UPI00404301E1
MARYLFGGTAADVAEDVAGARVPGATGTVWDGASEGAAQVTDLTDLAGAPLTMLVADEDGMIPGFYGPDGAVRLWMDFGGPRVALVANDVGERLAAHVAADDPHGSRAAVLAELTALRGAANGLATLDTTGKVPASQIPSLSAPDLLDWLNVQSPQFGAVGDGVTDDTNAIQAAINVAGIGGIVYFPKGVYVISAPLDLPRGVTLLGSHSNLMIGPGMVDEDFPCYIQAAPSMTTGAMIQIVGENDGTHPAINGEQRIFGLMLDGSKVTAGNLDGIYSKGNVQNVVMRDVCIRKMPNNGIITGSNAANEWPYSWRLHSVMVDNCKANGIVFDRQTDLSMIDVQVIGCWSTGIRLTNSANTILQGCRAEWCGGYGFHITGAWGNWPGSGSMTMNACSTDRNGWDGVRVDATGNSPFIINALNTRRDGRNGGPGGGGYAGLALLNRAPVIVNGLGCYVGTDDQGTANTSPQYGVKLSGARDVLLDGAYLHGATQGLYDDGTNERIVIGVNVSTVAGNNYAEDRASLLAQLGPIQAKSGVIAGPLNVGTAGPGLGGSAGPIIALKNADTSPTSNPTNGVLLYSEGGVLKVRDAGGRVASLADLGTLSWQAHEHNLKAWTQDPATCGSTGSANTSGVLYLSKVILRFPTTINSVYVTVTSAGTGLTTGQNLVGLYDANGVKVSESADQSAVFNSVGTKNVSIASKSLAAGTYYVAVLTNGSTPPSLMRGGGASGSALNVGLPGNAGRFLDYSTGLTSLPANVNLSAAAQNASARWAAIA